MLTEEQLQQFRKDGVLVVENILTAEEIEEYRTKLRQDVPYCLPLKDELEYSDKRKFLENSFYYVWKLELQAKSNIYNIFKQLYLENADMYGTDYDNVLPFIDRIGIRYPDNIYREGGLNLHVDKPGLKYRPIQGFVTLTDQTTKNHGGLQLIKGFYQKHTNHQSIYDSNLKNNRYLLNKLSDIKPKAGSMVIWDYRLPHKTNEYFDSNDTREVVYLSWIPNTKQNKKYHKDQYNNMMNGLPPPDFIRSSHNRNPSLIPHLTEHLKQIYGTSS